MESMRVRVVTSVVAVLFLLVAGGCIIRSTRPGVTVEASAPPPPTTVVAASAPIESASGVVSYPGETVRYPLNIQYPQTVNIYVAGHGLDPTLTVYDPYGNQIGFNDDGGSGLDSQLVLTLNPGTYILEVSGFGGSTGGFTITVQ